MRSSAAPPTRSICCSICRFMSTVEPFGTWQSAAQTVCFPREPVAGECEELPRRHVEADDTRRGELAKRRDRRACLDLPSERAQVAPERAGEDGPCALAFERPLGARPRPDQDALELEPGEDQRTEESAVGLAVLAEVQRRGLGGALDEHRRPVVERWARGAGGSMNSSPCSATAP